MFARAASRQTQPAVYVAGMRYALAAVIIATATTAYAAGPISTPQLQRAWGAANADCQGSTDPEGYEAKVACQKRDYLWGRLAERGFCYGFKGQSTSQYRWHRCTADSIQADD